MLNYLSAEPMVQAIFIAAITAVVGMSLLYRGQRYSREHDSLEKEADFRRETAREEARYKQKLIEGKVNLPAVND